MKLSTLYRYLTDSTEYILQSRITRCTTKTIRQLSRQNRSVNSSHSQLVTCDELIVWRVDWHAAIYLTVSNVNWRHILCLPYCATLAY